MLSSGKTFKIFLVMLLFASSSLTVTPRLQMAQGLPDQTALPTYWPSVYFCNGTAFSYDETFTGGVGDTITIALVAFNLTDNKVDDPGGEGSCPLGNLEGFDVQISWNPTVLQYVSHTVTVPVEDYPSPIPPSPYAGILHEEAFELVNKVNETDAIPNAEPGTMAWFAYSIMPGAAVFNGNGTFFTMTFNVISRGSSPLKLTNLNLSGEGAESRKVKFLHKFDGVFRTVDAPTADFTFWPNIGVENKSVIFNASASYSPDKNLSISKYIWDFDDGTNATVNDPIISHSYVRRAEAYAVSLVVEDSNGTRSSPETQYVSVVKKRNVKINDVSLMPAAKVLANRTVDVKILLENDGGAEYENCTVRAYYNATAVNWTDISTTDWIKIGEVNVSIKGQPAPEHLTWNTTGVPLVDAYYYVLANATLVPYEDPKDNNKTSRDPILVTSTQLRDVAVEDLECGWSDAFEFPVLNGEKTTFQITVKNEGTENETSVNVTLYNGSSLLTSWNQTIPYGQTVKLKHVRSFDVGAYNITGRATIGGDVDPDNDIKRKTLQVIRTPKLNFTYDPKTPYVNQTVSFNASASYHGEPGVNIIEYKWYLLDPRGTSRPHSNGPDLINITNQFREEGEWRMVLSVTDSYHITYSAHRTATLAYQIGVTIDVQAPPRFPIDYIILLVVVVIIVVAVLAVIIYRRRRLKT